MKNLGTVDIKFIINGIGASAILLSAEALTIIKLAYTFERKNIQVKTNATTPPTIVKFSC